MEVVHVVMFTDRVDAGRRLARSLSHLVDGDTVVLGLPRGGVPVAAEVAHALGVPLDVILVRKLGLPQQPELAMGAVGEGGVRVLDRDLITKVGLGLDEVRRVEERERAVLDDRASTLRRGHPAIDLTGRTAVIVDDGIATGSTARVACEVARQHGARRVILAAPVAPHDACRRIPEADDVIIASTPHPFMAVGNHYRDFRPTTDQEVIRILDAASSGEVTELRAAKSAVTGEDVEIPVGRRALGAHLTVPDNAIGIVAFAHGSGSSRHSPRNKFVAGELNRAGIATLLLDLLTEGEEEDRSNVFDIPLLAGRLLTASEWLAGHQATRALPTGYFGASTGAGAALYAAAEAGERVRAVVSRGGRPDLAGRRLSLVTAPTLLIVGSRDETVLALNERARARMQCPTELKVVQGATHLFEEPGTLAEVAGLSAAWFAHHLKAPAYGHVRRQAL